MGKELRITARVPVPEDVFKAAEVVTTTKAVVDAMETGLPAGSAVEVSVVKLLDAPRRKKEVAEPVAPTGGHRNDYAGLPAEEIERSGVLLPGSGFSERNSRAVE